MGIRVFLISINTVTTPYAVHPLGIAHLTGALRQRGHEVEQFDILAEPDEGVLAGRLTAFNPDLIGISIRNIDSVDSADPQFFLAGAKVVIDHLRRHSAAPLVIGGGAFSLFPEKIMDLLAADFGVTGEGEQTLCDLANALETGNPPEPGTILTGSATQDGTWKPVAYDQAIAQYYLSYGGMLNIQTKRGCPFKCDYCSYPLLEGRRYRYRDPEQVADEVMRLAQDYKSKYVFFTDSVFNDLKGKYLEVAEALIRRGNKTPWCAYFRPSRLDKEALEILKRSGLHSIEFGTDAMSDATLKGMHKSFTMDEVVATQRLTEELGIPAAHFVIIGGPEETEETFEEGLANMERLGNSVVFAFSGVRILPNAPIQQRALLEGIVSADDDLLEPVFYFSPHIDREKMECRLQQAWKGRSTRIFPITDSLSQTAEMHKMGFAGPLWDKLLSFRRK